MPHYENWNGAVTGEVMAIERPASEAEVVAIVRRARAEGRRIKAIGGRHSFNDIGYSSEILVDLSRLNRVIAVDRARGVVRVQGGMRLLDLVVALEREGLALPNIGAWLEQTISGVISTATHGSAGRCRRNLVDAVAGIRLVDGTGAARELTMEELGCVTLGMFGVITEVRLACVPLYYVIKRKHVVDMDEAIERMDELLDAHDFVDLRWAGRIREGHLGTWEITDRPPTVVDRLRARAEGVGLYALNTALHRYPYRRLPQPVNDLVFHALGVAYVRGSAPSPRTEVWYRGLTFNSLGLAAPHEERELAVPRERARACLRAVRREMASSRESASIEVQVRFSPPVDLLLAPNSGRETVWVNFNIFDRREARAHVDRLSEIVLCHDARPHWAKVVPGATSALLARYGDDVARWERVRARLDPDGVFVNGWYERHLRRTEEAAEQDDQLSESNRSLGLSV